jgi:hypothetical protein
MKYEGLWHITTMEMWDEDYLNGREEARFSSGWSLARLTARS